MKIRVKIGYEYIVKLNKTGRLYKIKIFDITKKSIQFTYDTPPFKIGDTVFRLINDDFYNQHEIIEVITPKKEKHTSHELAFPKQVFFKKKPWWKRFFFNKELV